jgi:hypothetical protein
VVVGFKELDADLSLMMQLVRDVTCGTAVCYGSSTSPWLEHTSTSVRCLVILIALGPSRWLIWAFDTCCVCRPRDARECPLEMVSTSTSYSTSMFERSMS